MRKTNNKKTGKYFLNQESLFTRGLINAYRFCNDLQKLECLLQYIYDMTVPRLKIGWQEMISNQTWSITINYEWWAGMYTNIHFTRPMKRVVSSFPKHFSVIPFRVSGVKMLKVLSYAMNFYLMFSQKKVFALFLKLVANMYNTFFMKISRHAWGKVFKRLIWSSSFSITCNQ